MSLREAFSSLYVLLVSGWEVRTTPQERFMVWVVPVLLMLGMAAASELAVQNGYLLLPYTCAVFIVAGVSNRICVRSGLLAAATGALLLNWLLSLPGSGQTAAIHQGLHFPGVAELWAWALMFGIAVIVAPRRHRARNPRIFDNGQNLPFTRQGNGEDDISRSLHGHGLLFWDPPSVKSDQEGWDVGTAYGNIFSARIQNGENTPRISWMVHDMVKRGPEQYGPVEIGFLETIAQRLTAGRRPNDQ